MMFRYWLCSARRSSGVSSTGSGMLWPLFIRFLTGDGDCVWMWMNNRKLFNIVFCNHQLAVNCPANDYWLNTNITPQNFVFRSKYSSNLSSKSSISEQLIRFWNFFLKKAYRKETHFFCFNYQRSILQYSPVTLVAGGDGTMGHVTPVRKCFHHLCVSVLVIGPNNKSLSPHKSHQLQIIRNH